MGLEIEEGVGIINLTAPTGNQFPLIGSPGELFNIVNSLDSVNVKDGMYVYTSTEWKRFAFTGEVAAPLPIIIATRTFETTTAVRNSPQAVTWNALSNTFPETYTTTGESQFNIMLPGTYKITYKLKVKSNTTTTTNVTTALTKLGVVEEDSRSTVSLTSAIRNGTLVGELDVTIIAPTSFVLYFDIVNTARSVTYGPEGNIIIQKVATT